MQIKQDCRFFKGNIPCIYHKNKKVHCWDCKFYEPINIKILIIKLGAAGDVIRTTPLLHKIRQVYSNAEITWITHFPELIPSLVDSILNFEFKNILYLINNSFDIACNLDKDKEACALINMIHAKSKSGFKLENGKVAPINKDAEHKWLTGLFDDVNKKNGKSYVQEIFEIFGVKFDGEKYIFNKPVKKEWNISRERPLIGLNTGCGDRWKTRIWPERCWVDLAKLLKKANFNVILLGGQNEDRKNKIIARKADVNYLGCFSLKDFISLLDQCDVIVTAVTMALHIAIALEKKIVLFNNVFNRNEFELYNLGEIIEPNIPCVGCYKPNCSISCMEKIDPKKVFEVCKKLFKKNI